MGWLLWPRPRLQHRRNVWSSGVSTATRFACAFKWTNRLRLTISISAVESSRTRFRRTGQYLYSPYNVMDTRVDGKFKGLTRILPPSPQKSFYIIANYCHFTQTVRNSSFTKIIKRFRGRPVNWFKRIYITYQTMRLTILPC